jgi:hypothetical protein
VFPLEESTLWKDTDIHDDEIANFALPLLENRAVRYQFLEPSAFDLELTGFDHY